MKQEYEAFGKVPFSEMTTEQITALFARYKFKDELGHDLLNCHEFQQMVSQVSAPPSLKAG